MGCHSAQSRFGRLPFDFAQGLSLSNGKALSLVKGSWPRGSAADNVGDKNVAAPCRLQSRGPQCGRAAMSNWERTHPGCRVRHPAGHILAPHFLNVWLPIIVNLASFSL